MAFREYRRAVRCEHRPRWARIAGPAARCRRPLLGQCQYCARGFCARHGRRLDDGQEICIAARCEAKRIDVAGHLEFKARAAAANAAARCGMPDCAAGAGVGCDRCNLRYCGPHVAEVMMSVMRGAERQAEALKLCLHCRGRLELWKDD